MAQAILGGDPAYDGPFYRERSPINVIDKVRVPTFFIGGEHDLFQRGTPMLFERLQKNGVPDPDDLGSVGPPAGLLGRRGSRAPDTARSAELQLRWFDRYVRGRKDAKLLSDIKPLTYFEQGPDRWVRTPASGSASDLHAVTFRLSGSARAWAAARPCSPAARPSRAAPSFRRVPVTGLCTRSANQWTAGVPRLILKDLPCFKDNRLNDYGGVVFETAPLQKRLRIQGPINARLFASTITGDGMLSVAVEDVAPNGKVTPAHRRLAGHLPAQACQAALALPGREADPGLPPVHARLEGEAGARQGGAHRRGDLPDRCRDPARAPAAAEHPGVRHPAPAPDAAGPDPSALTGDHPCLEAPPVGADAAGALSQERIATPSRQ